MEPPVRVAPLILLAALSACTKWVTFELPLPEVEPPSDTVPPYDYGRARLTLRCGEVRTFSSAVLVADSIRGELETPHPDSTAVSVVVPTSKVARLEIRRGDPVRTVFLIGGLAATAAAMHAMRDFGPWDGSISVPCGLLGEPCPRR